ncbi:FAD/NAD(P)-binding domain-containing protein [Lindgomyces ingoldianus]|uniref:FAD/NAD(P)-binding domain-containing protein n=1 Tax=Lindgomyces ingoldianus TaxID=673940 RepID=A0ACB6QKG6_9PLEO|nr:FAD/NAD(P)-binding domain-containing protein [Lindgomyces ingoldianus]KAF2467416.1 FAD/NAD(P)-binding domain-containing protein [Lindgomyces ingoldianus]
MSTTSIRPKIALIGAGPASLTLANILQNHSIPFTIYESSSTIRSQGGSLDLHPRTGQLALKEANRWDQFAKHCRPESDVTKLVDIFGEVCWDEGGADKHEVREEEKFDGRPEIDRAKLMELLHENITPEAIKFNKKLSKAVPSITEAKKYDLQFADGTIEKDVDLVVGGDGAWSKVRDLLTGVKPQYSGITAIEIWAFDVKEKNPWLANYVGEGSMFSFGEGRAVQAQRQGDGSLRTYASMRAPENFVETCGIDWNDHASARKAYVDQNFSDIGEDLKRVILESSDNLIPRTMYELPIGITWPSRSGVTLIGDAAHLMTPFAGVGVNVSMFDALELSKAIVAAWNGQKGLDEAVQEYEKELFPRAEMFMKKTEKNKRDHFSEDGTRRLAAKIRAFHAGELQGSKSEH